MLDLGTERILGASKASSIDAQGYGYGCYENSVNVNCEDTFERILRFENLQ
jgi:hypothetical protein